MFRNGIVVMTVIVMAGCAVHPQTSSTPAKAPISQSRLTTGVPAADRLYAEGERLRKAGDLTGAIEHYERGLRIAPRSPLLYLGLGNAYLARGVSDKALQMAQRSLSLLANDGSEQMSHIKSEADSLISSAKSLEK